MKLKMKLIIKLFCLFIYVFISVQIWAQNTNPVVSNVAFSISGTTVTVTYDVSDTEQSVVTVIMEVSNNGGITWDYDYGTASGDIGVDVTTGNGKTITWIYTDGYAENFKIKIIANDETADGSPCPNLAKVYYDGGPNNDEGGDYYNTIQIGDQCWLKENLNVGTRIDGSSHQTNNSLIEKYCYDDNESDCTTYGGLYQWAEAIQYLNGATNTSSPDPAFSGNVQGICPTGWHIPTYEEFTTLCANVGWDNTSLKAVGEGIGTGKGTNTSGFLGLLAGYSQISDGFNYRGIEAVWFSSTETNSSNSYQFRFSRNGSLIFLESTDKANGCCVRCLKD